MPGLIGIAAFCNISTAAGKSVSQLIRGCVCCLVVIVRDCCCAQSNPLPPRHPWRRHREWLHQHYRRPSLLAAAAAAVAAAAAITAVVEAAAAAVLALLAGEPTAQAPALWDRGCGQLVPTIADHTISTQLHVFAVIRVPCKTYHRPLRINWNWTQKKSWRTQLAAAAIVPARQCLN